MRRATAQAVHHSACLAAPIGGSAMIAGWLAIAIAGILELRSGKK